MKFNSQIVSSASGSIGGCTYSRNRSGQYIRRRALPINPGSEFQQITQGFFASLVTRWTSTLTQTQRDAWDIWAINTPQDNGFGSFSITGQNAFIRMNSVRLQAGKTVVDAAPTIYAGATITPPSVTNASAATDDMEIIFTNTDLWATQVGGGLSIFVGRPQNPSILFFKGPYRLASVLNGAVVPPTSPQTVPSPFPFATNQRIHVAFRAFNADARVSTQTRASTLSVA